MNSNSKVSLENLMIAAPCNVGWENMTGTDTVRHCHECKLNVYNVSRLTAPEAERLLSGAAFSQGKICLKFYRRHDGTILTADCPQGLRRIRSAKPKILRTIAAAVATIVAAIPASAEDASANKSDQVKDKNATPTAKTTKTEEFKGFALPASGRPFSLGESTVGMIEPARPGSIDQAQEEDKLFISLFSEACALEKQGHLEAAVSKYIAARDQLARFGNRPFSDDPLRLMIEQALAKVRLKQDEIRIKKQSQATEEKKSSKTKNRSRHNSGESIHAK